MTLEQNKRALQFSLLGRGGWAVAVLGMLVAFSLSAVSISATAEGQEQDDTLGLPIHQVGRADNQVGGADFRVFDFGSIEDREDFIHCVSHVTPDSSDATQLQPSAETCFREESEAAEFARNGHDGASGLQSRRNQIIGIHYDEFNYRGQSLTLSGSDCLGGGITLTGGRWDNRINSTVNGCSLIQHFDISMPYIFRGVSEYTVGYGANLNLLANKVSGILYKGQLLPPPPPPTIPPQSAV